jgi:hypothetical protein
MFGAPFGRPTTKAHRIAVVLACFLGLGFIVAMILRNIGWW